MKAPRHIGWLAILTLAGCAKTHEPRSLQYFESHQTERAEVVRKCKRGDGDQQYEPQAECAPAIEAEAKAQRAHDARAFQDR